MSETIAAYPKGFVDVWHLLWGDGFLSPGGYEEHALMLEGLDLTERTVLDIGCASGGYTIDLVRRFGAGRVVGIDVQAGLISQAKHRANQAGLTDVVSFQVVEPGPLAFPDESFDIVFCKGMLVHVADKGALFKEAFRVLKVEGYFVGDDWLLAEGGYDEAARRAFETMFIRGHGLVMQSEQATLRMMAEAGFAAIHLVDRSDWFQAVSKHDVQQMTGPLREQMVALQGPENAERMIRSRQSMVRALDGNVLRTVLFRTQKD